MQKKIVNLNNEWSSVTTKLFLNFLYNDVEIINIYHHLFLFKWYFLKKLNLKLIKTQQDKDIT